MKIHASAKLQGRVIGFHNEFETELNEEQIVGRENDVVNAAISIFKVKCAKIWNEDFATCVFFEVYFFKNGIKQTIFKKEKEMKIEVKRVACKPTYTIGKMYIDGVFFCDTLEDRVREDGVKVYGETAIPEGTYKLTLTMSNRFKKVLPQILDVPMFEGIRIHAGNTDIDTHGCILVGKNTELGKVTQSRDTMTALMSKLTDSKTAITITIN